MTHDKTKSTRIINFIERVCTHVKGDLAGQPFLLEEWQTIHPRFVRDNERVGVATISNVLCSDSAKEWKIKFVGGHCVGGVVRGKRTRRGNLLLRVITGPSENRV